jgi:cell division septal protein FtsQ
VSAPARAVAAARRRPSVARTSGRLVTAARLLAAVGLLVSSAALYGVTSSAAFELDRLDVAGAAQAAPDDVRETVAKAIGERPNVFRIRTAIVAEALRDLPAVREAEVRVVLPDRLTVTVTERAAILVLETDAARFLVDAAGRLFLVQPSGEDAPNLLLVRDRREFARTFEIGAWLDGVDLAVLRQLGALTPAAIGSKARGLELTVDDSSGWVLAARPASWRAVFGFYTTRTRRPDLIPAQVQCLRALLASSEKLVATVYLGRPGDRCGTYLPKTSS